MRTSDFDYHLPPELIAQTPVEPRDSSRLLVLHRATGNLEHRRFQDILEYLKPGDVMVFNQSRVIPARLHGRRKDSGGRVELLLVRRESPGVWEALGKPGRRLRPGAVLVLGTGEMNPPSASETPSHASGGLTQGENPPNPPLQRGAFGTPYSQDDSSYSSLPASAPLSPGGSPHSPLSERRVRGDFEIEAEVLESLPEGIKRVRLSSEEGIERLGQAPLPPYIHQRLTDPQRYQTVYARQPGSVAAPTAGLHFTDALLERIQQAGVEPAFITLHVGLDTFRPVQGEDPEEHHIHTEYYEVPPEAAETLERARREGRRIIAVGTTSVRVLEQLGRGLNQAGRAQIASAAGQADIFILPGHRFRLVDAMITNFHLPRSTLLMLVSAFAGRERILHAYQEAIEQRYRFYSFGDAMLIE
jgi:S-adenosylmethionine:tRNA ribosyltransferase-isomerase